MVKHSALALGHPSRRAPRALLRMRAIKLLHLRARELHDLRPLRLFAIDIGGIFLRRHRHHLGAILRDFSRTSASAIAAFIAPASLSTIGCGVPVGATMP